MQLSLSQETVYRYGHACKSDGENHERSPSPELAEYEQWEMK
jgi:hypothetical protein